MLEEGAEREPIDTAMHTDPLPCKTLRHRLRLLRLPSRHCLCLVWFHCPKYSSGCTAVFCTALPRSSSESRPIPSCGRPFVKWTPHDTAFALCFSRLCVWDTAFCLCFTAAPPLPTASVSPDRYEGRNFAMYLFLFPYTKYLQKAGPISAACPSTLRTTASKHRQPIAKMALIASGGGGAGWPGRTRTWTRFAAPSRASRASVRWHSAIDDDD